MRQHNKIHRLLPLGTLLLLLLPALTSCYKDQSTLAVNPIAPIELDTTGIDRDLFVEYLDDLVLDPKLENREGLTFKWEIYETTDDRNTDKITIGEELKLEYKVTRPQHTKPYNLVLTITDTKNGDLEKVYRWNLTVQGAILSGLLVAETADGQTTELSYIKSPNVTSLYKDKETKVLRNLLSATKAGPIQGKVTRLVYNYFGYPWSRGGTFVWAVTDDGQLLRLDHKDMEKSADLEGQDIVVYKPETGSIKAEQLFLTSGSLLLRTNLGYYFMPDLTRSFSSPAYFQIPEESLMHLSIDNDELGYMCGTNNSVMAVYYNDDTGRIEYLNYTKGYPSIETYTKNDAFDPNDLPGQSAIAVGNTSDKKGARFLLKDASGTYKLYTVNNYVKEEKRWGSDEILVPGQEPTALRLYSIPQQGKEWLDRATSVFFAPLQDLLYIVSENDVRALTYSSLTTEMTPVDEVLYTIPADEKITSAKIMVQGEFLLNECRNSRKNVLPWNNSSLIIVSQKGAEGIVRIIPIDPENATRGTLLPDKGETHTGFNRVLYVAPIGD